MAKKIANKKLLGYIGIGASAVVAGVGIWYYLFAKSGGCGAPMFWMGTPKFKCGNYVMFQGKECTIDSRYYQGGWKYLVIDDAGDQYQATDAQLVLVDVGAGN